MITYVVDLAERSYPIHIGSGTLSMLGAELQRLKATRALIVTNTTVGPLYAQKAATSVAQTEIPFSVCELPDGEEFKDLGHLNQILTAAAEAGLDRHSVIVALGGGVVGIWPGLPRQSGCAVSVLFRSRQHFWHRLTAVWAARPESTFLRGKI